MVDMLESEGAEVVLSHPRRTRAIASAKVKTDAIDARTLADLLRVGLLPQSYMPPQAIQSCAVWRVPVRPWWRRGTRFKNQVHGMLTQAGLARLGRTPSGKPAGHGWRGWSCPLETG